LTNRLSSWESPTWRDRIAWLVGDTVGALGASNQTQRRFSNSARSWIDMVPVLNDAVGIDETGRALAEGNYREAAMKGIPTAFGLIPGGGDFAAPIAKAIFAGIGAKTANRELMKTAEKMAGEGASRESIWDATGIRAYHGSPHSFDKFSLGKIGTGEGAQAYGHGLYFAEAEDTARSYRDALSNTLATDAGRISHGDADYAIMEAGRTVGGVSQRQLDTLSTNIVEALRNDMDPADVVSTLAKTDQERVAANAMIEAAKQYRKGDPGHMYEVNINANPDDFLDWDKPLSEQGPKVQDGLRKLWGSSYERRIADPYNSHGQDLAARTMDPVNGRAYTQELRQAGIPGIKYLDAGSRGVGQGSRNYVVFDENLINIVKKYGIAGAVGAGLISQQMADQMESQGVL